MQLHYRKTIPLTAEKIAELQKELLVLEQDEKETLARLTTAREMGDLSENGAYKYAKFELGRIRGQLKHVRRLVNTSYSIESSSDRSVVSLGSTVTIENSNSSGKPLTVKIVSHHESDPAKQKLSSSSPIGRAIMGKKVGDLVVVSTPSGEQKYSISDIE